MDIQEYKGTLAGKVVLITGAGGGIGLETAMTGRRGRVRKRP